MLTKTPANQPSRAIFALIAIGVLVAALVASWRLIDTGSGSEPGADIPGAGGGGPAPEDIQKVMDGLPIPSGWVVDEGNIYTGGSSLESIFWSRAKPSEVTSEFSRALAGPEWRVSSGPSESVVAGSDKSAGGATSTVSFSNTQFTVTVTAAEDAEKDPARGTTAVGVRVERLETAP